MFGNKWLPRQNNVQNNDFQRCSPDEQQKDIPRFGEVNTNIQQQAQVHNNEPCLISASSYLQISQLNNNFISENSKNGQLQHDNSTNQNICHHYQCQQIGGFQQQDQNAFEIIGRQQLQDQQFQDCAQDPEMLIIQIDGIDHKVDTITQIKKTKMGLIQFRLKMCCNCCQNRNYWYSYSKINDWANQNLRELAMQVEQYYRDGIDIQSQKTNEQLDTEFQNEESLNTSSYSWEIDFETLNDLNKENFTKKQKRLDLDLNVVKQNLAQELKKSETCRALRTGRQGNFKPQKQLIQFDEIGEYDSKSQASNERYFNDALTNTCFEFSVQAEDDDSSMLICDTKNDDPFQEPPKYTTQIIGQNLPANISNTIEKNQQIATGEQKNLLLTQKHSKEDVVSLENFNYKRASKKRRLQSTFDQDDRQEFFNYKVQQIKTEHQDKMINVNQRKTNQQQISFFEHDLCIHEHMQICDDKL